MTMPAKKTTKKVASSKSKAKSPPNQKAGGGSSLRKKANTTGKATKKAIPKISREKIHKSQPFTQAESKAKEYINNPKKLGKLFRDAVEKSKKMPKDPFGETWAYLQAMIRLLRAYANGSYREIPVGSLLMILVAIIYVVTPADCIPDVIPVIGHVDDALVVSLTIKQVKTDLDAFMGWEIEQAMTKA